MGFCSVFLFPCENEGGPVEGSVQQKPLMFGSLGGLRHQENEQSWSFLKCASRPVGDSFVIFFAIFLPYLSLTKVI